MVPSDTARHWARINGDGLIAAISVISRLGGGMRSTECHSSL